MEYYLGAGSSNIGGPSGSSYGRSGSSNQGSSYIHQVRFLRRLHQGGAVSGFLSRIPDAQYIDWVREWLRHDDKGMYVGVSMSIFNGDLFDDGNFPSIGSRSVLDQFYQVSSSYGQNRVAFDCLSVIENPDPSEP